MQFIRAHLCAMLEYHSEMSKFVLFQNFFYYIVSFNLSSSLSHLSKIGIITCQCPNISYFTESSSGSAADWLYLSSITCVSRPENMVNNSMCCIAMLWSFKIYHFETFHVIHYKQDYQRFQPQNGDTRIFIVFAKVEYKNFIVKNISDTPLYDIFLQYHNK